MTRERVNHGHDSWNPATGQWVPDYQSWCAACRAAARDEVVDIDRLAAALDIFERADNDRMPKAWEDLDASEQARARVRARALWAVYETQEGSK